MENQTEPQQNIQHPGVEGINIDYPKAQPRQNIIKVVGVGGGGSNAVAHMYEENIKDVSFLIINTDKQALDYSPVSNKLQIGNGLGAGAKPEKARNAAEEGRELIRQALDDGTQMVFITAGMGGGTGTGAAPIVAEVAHELGLLTVGIVTIPFQFEGNRKIRMALDGVHAIEKWCDALLVINNNRLIDIYPDLDFGNAFDKADQTLSVAARSISDIINKIGYVNLDYEDVATTLRNGGVALISTGQTSGEGRLRRAIEAATTSPLLQDSDIHQAKRLLFEICFSHSNPLSMSEIGYMNEYVDMLDNEIEVIWGAMYDDTLGDDVRIIMLASGFAIGHDDARIFVENDTERRRRELTRELQQAIGEMQNHLSEFEPGQPSYAALNSAIQSAKACASADIIEVDVEGEKSALVNAYNQALEFERQRHEQDVKERERKAAEEKAEAERLVAEEKARAERAAAEEAQQRIAMLQAEVERAQREAAEAMARAQAAALAFQQATPAATPVSPQSPAVQVTPAVPENTAAQTAPVAPAAPIAQTAPAPAPTPAPAPAEPKPSYDDDIRRYYGENAANQMKFNEVRKRFFVFDDKDLSNEDLAMAVEQKSAQERTDEDMQNLFACREASPTQQPNNSESIF